MNWISRLLGREPAEDAASVGRLVVVAYEAADGDVARASKHDQVEFNVAHR